MLRTGMAILLVSACAAVGQIRVPEGSPVRVRVMSEVTADAAVECVVAEEVRAMERVVIPVGSPVRATAIGAKGEDLSIQAVQVNGKWAALRYSPAGAAKSEIRGVRQAGLKRADQADQAVGRGATYVLYLDRTVSTGVELPSTPKKTVLGWLMGDPEAGNAWMQRYSNWLCAGGLLMLLFGIAYHCLEDWDYWSRKLVRLRADSH